MAKKKAPAGKRAPATVKSIAFRVSAEYAAWVEGLAAHNRSTIAGLMDQALASYAQEKGYEQPPGRA